MKKTWVNPSIDSLEISATESGIFLSNEADGAPYQDPNKDWKVDVGTNKKNGSF